MTLTRKPRLSSSASGTRVRIFSTAESLSRIPVTPAIDSPSGGRLALLVLAHAPVLHGCLDRVLGKNRAVDLDRRERQLLDDVGVLDLLHLVDRLPLHQLGHVARARDRAAAAERLEARILD